MHLTTEHEQHRMDDDGAPPIRSHGNYGYSDLAGSTHIVTAWDGHVLAVCASKATAESVARFFTGATVARWDVAK